MDTDSEPESYSEDENLLPQVNPCPCCEEVSPQIYICSCTQNSTRKHPTEAPFEGMGVDIPNNTNRVCCECGQDNPSKACYECECTFCSSVCEDFHYRESGLHRDPSRTNPYLDSSSFDDGQPESSKRKKQEDSSDNESKAESSSKWEGNIITLEEEQNEAESSSKGKKRDTND